MSDEILQQTNKRLTLNLLIQGAASHSYITAHHLIKDELEHIRPGFTRLYDQMAISAHLCYWLSDMVLLYGPSWWFWRRTHRPGHPFRRFPLLARHGRDLARASKKNLCVRGREKRVTSIPVLHYFQAIALLAKTAWAERAHRTRLSTLAKRATSQIWGIDEDRLEATFTTEVAFGNIPTPRTAVGRFTKNAACGWGGVEHRDGQFHVVAKSWVLPLILHELTKATAELVCLHGLNRLDDDTFDKTISESDQIEYEMWMMQAGPEMWRQLLAVLPADSDLAEMLMHIARLDPQPLEQLMLAVIEEPDQARGLLMKLG